MDPPKFNAHLFNPNTCRTVKPCHGIDKYEYDEFSEDDYSYENPQFSAQKISFNPISTKFSQR